MEKNKKEVIKKIIKEVFKKHHAELIKAASINKNDVIYAIGLRKTDKEEAEA